MQYILLFFVTLILWFSLAGHQPVAKWEGATAQDVPEQTKTLLPEPWMRGRYTIKPLARYHVKAVVLSVEHYSLGTESELSPVDLALGWGPMSDPEVINKLKITQGARWYNYYWKNTPPIPVKDIVAHSANTHCIPEDMIIERELMKIKRHDIVELQGYLVRVERDDGWRWISSLTRTDSGAGSCELLMVAGVSIYKP